MYCHVCKVTYGEGEGLTYSLSFEFYNELERGDIETTAL